MESLKMKIVEIINDLQSITMPKTIDEFEEEIGKSRYIEFRARPP